MTLHTAAFSESLDPAGAFVNIATIQDGVIRASGDDLVVPSLNRIVAIMGLINDDAEAELRLRSPTLDALAPHSVRPLNTATDGVVEPASPARVEDLRRSPLRVTEDEILHAETDSNPGAGGAQDQRCLVWFSDGPVAVAEPDRCFTVRATFAGNTTADAWTAYDPTLDFNLQAGRYQIIGGYGRSATGLAMRINVLESTFRPAVPCQDTIADAINEMFRHGRMGVLGEFQFNRLPQIEFLTESAEAPAEALLDLVKVA